jgi:hypothetical protein
MNNYCSQCGQRLSQAQLQQQALYGPPLGNFGLASAGCLPPGSVTILPTGVRITEANSYMAGRAQTKEAESYWHSVKVSLSAEEMEAERKREEEE